jgi:AcrR family transcriptional regulator
MPDSETYMLHLRNCYDSRMDKARVDGTLLDATEAILIERGLDGVSLERVAQRVDRSRVTLWRQGVTRDALLDALLGAVADD